MLYLSMVIFLLGLRLTSTDAECGVPNDKKIIGGNDTGKYLYPWFAQLRLYTSSGQAVCGGTLISKQHVLTAAHCFSISSSSTNENLYKVVLGVYDSCNKTEPTKQTFSVARVDIHEKYDKNNKFYDVALLTLATNAVDFKPVCLPITDIGNTPMKCQIIGFGVTQPSMTYVPCTMRQATVTVFTRQQCAATSLPQVDVQGPGVFCAGDVRGEIDSCQGDSGGPLQCEQNGRIFVRGIVSYGYGCANIGFPGIYTNVFDYLSWIQSKQRLLTLPIVSATGPVVSASVPTISSGAGGVSNGQVQRKVLLEWMKRRNLQIDPRTH